LKQCKSAQRFISEEEEEEEEEEENKMQKTRYPHTRLLDVSCPTLLVVLLPILHITPLQKHPPPDNFV
jgi:hypothetical protein